MAVGSAHLIMRAALPACQTAMVRCSCCEQHPVRSVSHHGCSRGPRAASCDALSRCIMLHPNRCDSRWPPPRGDPPPARARRRNNGARKQRPRGPGEARSGKPVAQAPTPFSPSASNTRCELIAAAKEGVLRDSAACGSGRGGTSWRSRWLLPRGYNRSWCAGRRLGVAWG